jgi:hypothetical protein
LIFENDLYNMGILGLGVYKLEPRGWDSAFCNNTPRQGSGTIDCALVQDGVALSPGIINTMISV